MKKTFFFIVLPIVLVLAAYALFLWWIDKGDTLKVIQGVMSMLVIQIVIYCAMRRLNKREN